MRTASCFLLLTWLEVALSQSPTCSDAQLSAYMSCVEDNPCVCSVCDPDPMDTDPPIVLPEPPNNCQAMSRIFCPLINCCSICSDEAAAWYACAFEGLSIRFLNQTCPQMCSTTSFPYTDVSGDCSPTISPAPVPGVGGSTTSAPTPTTSPGQPVGGSVGNTTPVAPVSSSPMGSRSPQMGPVPSPVQPVSRPGAPTSSSNRAGLAAFVGAVAVALVLNWTNW